MRGWKHVAAIVPLSEDDLQLAPALTDAQAERLWRQLELERQKGATLIYDSVDSAVTDLRAADAPYTRRKRRNSNRRR